MCIWIIFVWSLLINYWCWHIKYKFQVCDWMIPIALCTIPQLCKYGLALQSNWACLGYMNPFYQATLPDSRVHVATKSYQAQQGRPMYQTVQNQQKLLNRIHLVEHLHLENKEKVKKSLNSSGYITLQASLPPRVWQRVFHKTTNTFHTHNPHIITHYSHFCTCPSDVLVVKTCPTILIASSRVLLWSVDIPVESTQLGKHVVFWMAIVRVKKTVWL